MGRSVPGDSIYRGARDNASGVAVGMGMRMTRDPSPEKGFFFRSDRFRLARRGVPAIFLDMGTDFRDRPAGWGERVERACSENDYHQPSAEFRPEWALTGAAKLGEIAYRLGLRAANEDRSPGWRPGEPLARKRGE